MSNRILGKTIDFKWDGVSVGLTSHNFSDEFNVIDVTDSETSGDTKESITSRATRTVEISGKVKDASTAQPGKDLKLTFNNTEFPLTSASYEENWDEIDVTDGGTSDSATEVEAGFAEKTSSFDLWMKEGTPAPVENSQNTAILAFTNNLTIDGNLRIDSYNNEANINDATKISMSGKWQGSITDNTSVPAGGIEKNVEIIYRPGGNTDDAITGRGIILSRSISTDINGDVVFSATVKMTGSITKTSYAT